VLSDLDWLRAFAISLVGEQRAEDLIQETATRALERPPRHQRNLHAWMKRIARNLAMSESRKNKIRRERVSERTPESFSDGYSTEPLPDRSIEAAEATADLLEVIGQLPAQQRVIVLRRFQHEVSITQISEDLGISERAVQKTIERARVNCQKVLRSRHGNGWVVPCLLVIQQPDTLAPIAPTLTSSSAPGALLSSTVKIGIGVAAGLALAIPLLLPPTEVEAAGRALPFGAIGAQAVGVNASGLYSGFQPDQRVRVGGTAASSEAAAARTSYTVFVKDSTGAPLEGVPILRSDLGTLGSSLTLRPGSYFDAEGNPRPGAAHVLTDASGRAALELLIDQETQLLAAHPNFAVQRANLVPKAGGQNELQLELTPAAQVQGRVVDQFGVPVAGVVVAAHPSQRGRRGRAQPEYRAVSNTQGEFRMVALQPGSYGFRLCGDATATIWTEATELRVGKNSAQLTIRPGNDIAGEVLGAEGEPLREARVWLVRNEELPPEQPDLVAPLDLKELQVNPQTGGFVVGNALFDGAESLLVIARGYQGDVFPLARPSEFQSIALKPSSFSLKARVFLDGRPVNDAVVNLSWNHGNGWKASSRTLRTSDGVAQFELDSVGAETHFDLTVIHAQGSEFLSSQVLHAASGEVRVDLQSGTPVTLRVMDSAGQPVANFPITATAQLDDPGAMDHLSVQFVSDANGECTWHLPNSTLSIWPQLPDLEQRYLVPAPLIVANGTPVHQELVVHEALMRTFQVSDQDGQPIRGRWVDFRAPDGSILRGGRTGDEGRLSLHQLIPGSYLPLLRPDNGLATTEWACVGDPIELDASAPEQLELRFSGLHSLKLRVELPAGQLAPDRFALVPHTPTLGKFAVLAYARAAIPLDENGETELEQLLPGEYWLMLPKSAQRPALTTMVRLPLATDSFVWQVSGTRLTGRIQVPGGSKLESKQIRLFPVVASPAGIAIDPLAVDLSPIEVSLDHEGNFVFPFVPNGEWELFAHDLGEDHLLRRRISIGELADAEMQLGKLLAEAPGTLRIELGPRLHSRLSSQLATSKLGVLALLNLDSQTWFNLQPDENGRAERRDLPVGRYQLYLFDEPVEEVRAVAAGEISALLVD
jgi:RNA polymerase sigma-70 factor, ECF subfamily